MTHTPGTTGTGAERLAGGYRHALWAADVFFGGFVIFMVLVAAFGWLRGDAPLTDLLAIGAFLVVNVFMSEVSRRTDRPYVMEVVRMIVGGAAAVAAYLLVTGPLAPWWPGFLILTLGGSIGLGLLTQRPTWGRAIVLYYLSLFLLSTVLRGGPIEWYAVALQAAVAATVGLMFAEVMSLLGQTLQQEHDRSLELQDARDALFAEMEVAQEIQTLLLPREPHLEDHLVEGRMVTADEVGGDYYDVIDAGNGRTLLAIGDVSGHGVTSGLTMMMARTSLVGAVEARADAPLPELYRVLNRCMCKNLERMDLSLYMTFALIEHLGEGRFRAVGRHLPLLIHRQATGEIEEVQLEGMWLGVLDDLDAEHLTETEFRLGAGDLLFLYTDGIVEQFAGEEMFGFDRLKDVIRTKAPEGATELIDAVLVDLGKFSEQKQEDDVTMLVVNHAGRVEATSAAA